MGHVRFLQICTQSELTPRHLARARELQLARLDVPVTCRLQKSKLFCTRWYLARPVRAWRGLIHCALLLQRSRDIPSQCCRHGPNHAHPPNIGSTAPHAHMNQAAANDVSDGSQPSVWRLPTCDRLLAASDHLTLPVTATRHTCSPLLLRGATRASSSPPSALSPMPLARAQRVVSTHTRAMRSRAAHARVS